MLSSNLINTLIRKWIFLETKLHKFLWHFLNLQRNFKVWIKGLFSLMKKLQLKILIFQSNTFSRFESVDFLHANFTFQICQRVDIDHESKLLDDFSLSVLLCVVFTGSFTCNAFLFHLRKNNIWRRWSYPFLKWFSFLMFINHEEWTFTNMKLDMDPTILLWS